jgi:hypothetical protein
MADEQIPRNQVELRDNPKIITPDIFIKSPDTISSRLVKSQADSKYKISTARRTGYPLAEKGFQSRHLKIYCNGRNMV